jgi:hypothetical protein
MSLCKQALWATEFTEPMPEGTTYWDFALKREKKLAGDDIVGQAVFIKQLKALNEPKLIGYIETAEDQLAEMYKNKINLEREGLDV